MNMGKKLAIKGHSTRSNEVIKLLEMLGGENKFNHDGQSIMYSYYISRNTILNDRLSITEDDDFVILNLEEFLEKYPYKVGDKVVYTKFGDDYPIIIQSMKWTGTTIEYTFDGCVTCLAKDLQPYKEEIMVERKYSDLRLDVDQDDKLSTEATIDGNKITPPENYLIGKITKVDNGMLVEFVKKQPQYPKTYDECCKVLEINPDNYLSIRHLYYGDGDEDTTKYEQDLLNIFDSLWVLKICRDAYWKIAGEQMGLDGPWNPTTEVVFCISRINNRIEHLYKSGKSNILEFPTPEMRDAFYENFKKEIEECKELL